MRITKGLHEQGVRVGFWPFSISLLVALVTVFATAVIVVPRQSAGLIPAVSGVVQATVGNTTGFALGDLIVSVDGRTIHDGQDLLAYYESQPAGTKVRHGVMRRSQALTITSVVRPFGLRGWLEAWAPLIAVSLVAAAMAILVYRRGILMPEARTFAWLCWSLSAAAALNNIFDLAPWLTLPFALASSAIGGLFIRLAQQLGPKREGSRWPVYLSLAIGTVAFLVCPKVGAGEADAATLRLMWDSWIFLNIAWPAVIGTMVFPAMILRNLRGHRRHELYYQQNRVILWSSTLAFLPLTVVWAPSLLGATVDPVLGNTSALALLLLPAGTLVAVLRYRLFDIDLVIRSTLTYTLTVTALAMLYTLSVAGVSTRVGSGISEGARFVMVMAVVLLFDPLRRTVRRHVDRWFDRGRLDLIEVQRKINQRAAEHHDTSQTLEGITHDLRDALRLTRCALALIQDDMLWLVAGETDLLGTNVPLRALPTTQEWEQTAHPDFPWPAQMVAGYTISQNDKPAAVLFLGEKRSDEPLTRQDFDYLGLISGQIGLLLSYTQMLDRQTIVDREMQKLLTKVSELNDLRASFGIVAGHELRTPLTVIQGHAELLLSGSFGELDDQQMESVQSIHRSASRMAAQISAYLDLVALREKRLVLRPTVCDLGTITYEALEPWDSDVEDKSLSLRVDVSGAPKVFADSRRVRKVIEQLVSNAVKFTPSGGNILITVRTKDQQVLLQVQDTGPGIPAEALDRAFDDFAQVADPTQRDHEGLGLGLPLAKALMEAMNGWVTYAAGPEGGSIFTCAFPTPAPVRDVPLTLSLEPEQPLRTRQVLDPATGLWKVVPDVEEREAPHPGVTLSQVVYESPTSDGMQE